MKYTSAVERMKTFLQWQEEVVQLTFVDVEPDCLWFEGDAEVALTKDAPCLSVSILVGQRWHQWDELSCEWKKTEQANLVGLRPLWSEDQEKDFKKHLELTLSI